MISLASCRSFLRCALMASSTFLSSGFGQSPMFQGRFRAIFIASITLLGIFHEVSAILSLSSRRLPGVDTPPAFAAACAPLGVVFYSTFTTVVMFELRMNRTQRRNFFARFSALGPCGISLCSSQFVSIRCTFLTHSMSFYGRQRRVLFSLLPGASTSAICRMNARHPVFFTTLHHQSGPRPLVR